MSTSRTPEELLDSALGVLDRAFSLSPRIRYTGVMIPLFSGGYDSLCATYVASRHPKFKGAVFHIDTTIGSKATRDYVDDTADEMGWRLSAVRSPVSYEQFVRQYGFPGPGGHQWAYARLKERALRRILTGRDYVVLVTGCRSEESTRRMGHVEPIKVGEIEGDGKGGFKVVNANRLWVAPCHDWTQEEQRGFTQYHGFPRNPVKDSVLGMSGECFCGAFARPNEFEMLEQVCPDVAREIRRLEQIARENGIEERNCKWGYRGKADGRKPVEVVETGPMCNTCDRKAAAAGIIVKSTCSLRKGGASNG